MKWSLLSWETFLKLKITEIIFGVNSYKLERKCEIRQKEKNNVDLLNWLIFQDLKDVQFVSTLGIILPYQK